MKKITIIDYGTSNLKSIDAAFKHLGYSTFITNDKKKIINCDKLVLPGVGSFPVVKDYLKKKQLDLAIKQHIQNGKPFLGICLGMQILFDKSYEFKETEGLGILKGEVKNLTEEDKTNKYLVPNTGWMLLKNNSAFKQKNIIDHKKNIHCFFTHSFFVAPKDNSIVSSYFSFGKKLICASVQSKNIFGMQFHPEKSGKKGLDLLSKFSKI